MPSEISHFHIVHTTVVHLTTAGVSHSVWLLTVFVIICRRHSLYCDHTKSLLGNNSGKSEPIGTTFYRRHRSKWHAPLQTFGALHQTVAKWRRKPNFVNFVTETTHRFTHFSEDDFREIWTWNVNRCHENFRNKISKFFRKGVIFPENLILAIFWGTLATRALQSKAKQKKF